MIRSILRPPLRRRGGNGSRGQALVETALVTPILLLMVLGVIGVSLLMLDRGQLAHAAREGAVAGAMNPGNSCGVAVVTARAISPVPLTVTDCAVTGQYLTLTVGHRLDLTGIAPIWSTPLQVTETARAALR